MWRHEEESIGRGTGQRVFLEPWYGDCLQIARSKTLLERFRPRTIRRSGSIGEEGADGSGRTSANLVLTLRAALPCSVCRLVIADTRRSPPPSLPRLGIYAQLLALLTDPQTREKVDEPRQPVHEVLRRDSLSPPPLLARYYTLPSPSTQILD